MGKRPNDAPRNRQPQEPRPPCPKFDRIMRRDNTKIIAPSTIDPTHGPIVCAIAAKSAKQITLNAGFSVIA